MALGSSAPEIILNIYETCITLGDTPGELGASTIVGSAAFNFLVISGVSIYAVNESNDNRDAAELEEDGTPHGVKKIYDLGVFSVTCSFSILAYCWVYYALSDFEVTPFEAWFTFLLMFALLIAALTADKCKQAHIKKIADSKFGKEATASAIKTPAKTSKYSPLEFYQTLLPIEMGKL